MSGDRLLELFECDMVMEDAPGAVPAPPFRGRVEFVDVSFGYRKDTPVLKNVSFAVEPGETVELSNVEINCYVVKMAIRNGELVPAPEEVVEEQRERLADAQTTSARLSAALERLKAAT